MAHAIRHPRRALRRPAILAAVLVGLALVAAACGSSTSAAPKSGGTTSSSHPARSGGTTITIDNFSFSPSTLTVKPGQKVTVVNKTSVTHTVTSTAHAFNTGDVKGGSTTSFTAPSKPGRYPYICLIHQYMTGTLVVS